MFTLLVSIQNAVRRDIYRCFKTAQGCVCYITVLFFWQWHR